MDRNMSETQSMENEIQNAGNISTTQVTGCGHDIYNNNESNKINPYRKNGKLEFSVYTREQ